MTPKMLLGTILHFFHGLWDCVPVRVCQMLAFPLVHCLFTVVPILVCPALRWCVSEILTVSECLFIQCSVKLVKMPYMFAYPYCSGVWRLCFLLSKIVYNLYCIQCVTFNSKHQVWKSQRLSCWKKDSVIISSWLDTINFVNYLWNFLK